MSIGATARAQSANAPATTRHLEQACARLQDAAEELETVLAGMPRGDGQADLHEAIGAIMETLQLIASAHARMEPSRSGMPLAAE